MIPAAALHQSLAPTHPPVVGPQRTITVVEDDRDSRESLCELLALEGFQTRDYDNAEAALAALTRSRELPMILVTDLHLPGINGLELAKRLRQHPKTRSLPVFLMTGSDTTMPWTGNLLDTVTVFTKPVDYDGFFSRLATL